MICWCENVNDYECCECEKQLKWDETPTHYRALLVQWVKLSKSDGWKHMGHYLKVAWPCIEKGYDILDIPKHIFNSI